MDFTTGEMRALFATDALYAGSYGDPRHAYADFDRWLARVQADAWDECLDEIEKYEINTQQAREGNPYRKEQN